MGELRRREARFVADAAHELRSPMTALSLQVDRLSQMPLSDDLHRRVEDMKEAIARTTNLVTQLLALKRAQAQSESGASSELASAGCLKVVSSILADLYWAADAKKITLDVEGLDGPQAEILAVAMNENDFGALVRNLVQNAINYTPEEGAVAVRVEPEADGSHVVIKVVDNGPGIAPAERQRVFDPFYRILGNKAQGTGLGLAICKTVVERAGGVITLDWADAANEKGLLVTVRLPRAADLR